MTTELIYSFWGADSSLLIERGKQALEVSNRVLPKVTFWKAIHQHQHGPEGRIEAKVASAIAEYGGTLPALWDHSVEHLANHDLNPNELVVSAAAYSEEMSLSVHIYIDDFTLHIEVESNNLERVLTQHESQFLALLRDMGARPAISGGWIRHQSAFAGDPVCLYEQPQKLFVNLSNPLRYDEVIDEVREVRESVRAAMSPGDWSRLLHEVGAQVETISSDRLFVKLADPNSKGGAPVLKKLEKSISSLLARK
jgi:hypothetical protein